MFTRMAAAVGLVLLLASTTGARAAETCPSAELLTIGGISIQPCHSSTMASPVEGSLSANYGVVLMSSSSGGTVNVDKGVGRYLRKLVGINDAFDAAVSLELVQPGGVIYQRPLFVVSVARGDKSKVEISNMYGNDIEISPLFVLPDGVGNLTARIKVSAISQRGSNIAGAVKQGVDAAQALGGHGWLVTAFGTEAFMAVLKLNEATLNSYYSDDLTATIDTNMRFDGAAFKSVRYEIRLPGPKATDPVTTVSVSLNLATRPSLLTSSFTTVEGRRVPDVTTISAPRWASGIRLQGNNKTFTTQLETAGLPQKLGNLQVSAGAQPDERVAKVAQVNADCMTLRKAITEGDFQLSPFDSSVILFDELRRAGVFKVYRPEDLSCTSDMVVRWKQYGLAAPKIEAVTNPSTPAQRVERLMTLAKHWGVADDATREMILPDNFQDVVQLTARPDLISGFPAPTAPDVNGFATWPVSSVLLAKLAKFCLGNFKQPPEAANWATAFVIFRNDPTSYLLRATFAQNKAFGGEGPKIAALSLKPATAQDKADFDLNQNCLVAPPV